MKLLKRIGNILVHVIAITIVTIVVEVSPDNSLIYKTFTIVDLVLAVTAMMTIWFIVLETYREYRHNKIIEKTRFKNKLEIDSIKHAKELNKLEIDLAKQEKEFDKIIEQSSKKEDESVNE